MRGLAVCCEHGGGLCPQSCLSLEARSPEAVWEPAEPRVEYCVYFTPWYKCPLSSALWVLKCYLLLSLSFPWDLLCTPDAFQAYDSLFWPEGWGGRWQPFMPCTNGVRNGLSTCRPGLITWCYVLCLSSLDLVFSCFLSSGDWVAMIFLCAVFPVFNLSGFLWTFCFGTCSISCFLGLL